MTSAIAECLKKCDPMGPTIVHITKLYNTTDALSFRAFGRVLSGTLKKGMPVKVLGEGYSPEDEEDMARAVSEELWIGESRFEVTTSSKLRFYLTRNLQICYSDPRSTCWKSHPDRRY